MPATDVLATIHLTRKVEHELFPSPRGGLNGVPSSFHRWVPTISSYFGMEPTTDICFVRPHPSPSAIGPAAIQSTMSSSGQLSRPRHMHQLSHAGMLRIFISAATNPMDNPAFLSRIVCW